MKAAVKRGAISAAVRLLPKRRPTLSYATAADGCGWITVPTASKTITRVPASSGLSFKDGSRQKAMLVREIHDSIAGRGSVICWDTFQIEGRPGGTQVVVRVRVGRGKPDDGAE